MAAEPATDAAAESTPPEQPYPGRRIVQVSWASNVLFAITAVPVAAGVDAFDAAAVAVSLILFVISLGVWCYAFAIAVSRSARGDDVVVGNLFLMQGPVPKAVRLHLFGSLLVCLAITAGTAAADPFGVLVPMMPLGLIGLWGARHGTYPARKRA